MIFFLLHYYGNPHFNLRFYFVQGFKYEGMKIWYLKQNFTNEHFFHFHPPPQKKKKDPQFNN